MAGGEKLSVVSICGSLRKGSYTAMIQRALPSLAPDAMSIEALAGVADCPLYNADRQAEGFPQPVLAMAQAIRQAAGVILVTPEYNYSVPGVLKNAIDWLSRVPDQPFKDKPVAIQSASVSMLGGARAQYHLRQVLVFVEGLPMNKPEVMVPMVAQKVDEKTGALTDQPTRDLIGRQLEAFAAFIRRVSA